jgi:5-methyltetrahydrofolate--homocysteine methyltransferase
LFLGSQPDFRQKTVWYAPIHSDITLAPEPVFDPTNAYWQLTCEMASRAKREFLGKSLIACCDLIENLDVLAALRGTTELLMDLIDHPQDVHRLQKAILTAYFACYDQLSGIIRDDDNGTCFMAFNIWGPGRVAKVQCDISAMLSPDMYAVFILPYLREQCQRIDYTLYHLDGPQAICHLDHLLSINELDAIQWTPGAGNNGSGDPMWYPLYERILRAGKSLHLGIGNPHLIEALFHEFGPDGILVQTRANSKDEAEALIEKSRSWM